jgi:hypothetical protein
MSTQSPQRSRRQDCLAVLTASAFLIGAVDAAAAAAPAGRAGAPPRVLNVVRQTLKRGAAPAYTGLETSIARAYHQAKIPLYWVCLQATKSPVEILYLNVYAAREDADRAEATYRDRVPKHPEILRLQQRLTALGAGPPLNTLTARRDEFVYGRGDIDFATMAALRVTVIHVRPGHEGDFVEAVRTGRAVPWQMYEDTASPTFFLLAPMRTPTERTSAGLPRALRRLKGIYTVDKTVVYAVRPAMSHAPPEYVAANARFKRQ